MGVYLPLSPYPGFRLFRAFALVGMLACSAGVAEAALLLYEGFAGYGTGNLSTKMPNANTIGLNTSVLYQGSGVSNYTLSGSSLVFSTNFATSGGSISTGTGTSVGGAQMSLAASYTGTLYSSYLVRLGFRGTGAGDGALSRIASSISNLDERFVSMPDSRSSSTEVAVGYDGTTVATGSILSLNTTYLMLSRYTRVGMATNVTSGVATVYALTSAQYDAFIAAGATQSYLDSTAIGTASNQISARGSDTYSSVTPSAFATGNFAQFVSVNDTSAFDELRYGTAWADVIPVPEPATAILLLAGGVVFGFRRKRRDS